MDASRFCVAALGGPQSHFTWVSGFFLRGRCTTPRSFRELGGPQSHFAWQVQHLGSPATIEYYGRRLLLRGRCSSLEDLSFILRGTQITSFSFCVAGAALGAPPERSKVRRRLSTMEACSFCVAGAAFGGPQSHFAWHSDHVILILRGRCSTRSTSREVQSPATIEYHGGLLLLSKALQRGPRKSGDD